MPDEAPVTTMVFWRIRTAATVQATARLQPTRPATARLQLTRPATAVLYRGSPVQSGAVAEPVLSVEPASTTTPELVDAFARLIPQLSRSSPPPGEAELTEMLASPGTTVFVARLGTSVVGTLTLVVFRIPTALRAWIEDVVVDDSARGHGAGEALTRAALDRAATLGAKTVELTSRPSREAANRLYQRLGFERRETNIYRKTLD